MDAQRAQPARQIRELKRQIRILQKENERLRALVGEQESTNTSISSASPPSTESSTDIPSYLRPTTASLNRTSPDQSTPKCSTLKSMRRDCNGKIVVSDSDMPGFVQTSRVYVHKRLSGDTQSEYDQSIEIDPVKGWTPPTPHRYDAACTCEECANQRAYWKAWKAAEELGQRTRLHDDEFCTNKMVSELLLHPEKQHRLLCRAYRLAQAAFMHAIRRFQPKERAFYAQRGPSFMRFESRIHPQGSDAGVPDLLILRKIGNMITLRNNVSHPDSHELEWVDRFIFYAQDLTVALQDEARALRLRRLRDELQSEALKEVKQLELLMTGLSKREWAYHQQYLCQTIARGIGRSHGLYATCEEKYGTFLVDAARAWRLQHIHGGRKREDYRLNLSRKASYLRDAGHGRRASVSIIQKQTAVLAASEQDDSIAYTLAKELFGSEEEQPVKLMGIEALDLSMRLPPPVHGELFVDDAGAKEEYPGFRKPRPEDSFGLW